MRNFVGHQGECHVGRWRSTISDAPVARISPSTANTIPTAVSPDDFTGGRRTRPGGKGVGGGPNVGVAVAVGVGVLVGEGVAEGVGVGVRVGRGRRVGVGTGVRVAVAVG